MREPGRRGRGGVRGVAAAAAAMAALAGAALAAGGCARKDVLFLVEVRLAEGVPRPATLTLAARVTRETGAGGEDTVDYATTVSRPWPGDDAAVRVQLALGPDAVAIELTATLLAADGFVIAEAGAAQAFPSPGRYAYLLSIEEGAAPPPDGGAGDGGGGDSATGGTDSGPAGGTDSASGATDSASGAGDAGAADGG